MNISVFLSYSSPCNKNQKQFIDSLKKLLNDHGFEPRTLGVTDYDLEEPLVAIRRLMLESNGMITVAFRRFDIESGKERKLKDGVEVTIPLDKQYFTSPWCHIEPAMAFQLGLPILVFREEGVIANGILERGVAGVYLPEFDLNDPSPYFEKEDTREILGVWEGYVRAVNRAKGKVPRHF